MQRRYEERKAPQITPEIAVSKFKKTLVDIYSKEGLSLPNENQVYLADSAVEADYGLGRVYNTSDIDILLPEPEGLSGGEVSLLEQEIRDELGESGVDFNFAPLEDLKNGDAYGRACRKIENFSWE